MGRARYQTTATAPPHKTTRIAISSEARFLGFTNAVSHSHRDPSDCRHSRPPRLIPQPDVRLKVAHHLAEPRKSEGLCAVADRLFGARMHFQDQPIRPDGDAGSRDGGNQAALTCGM